MSMSKIDKNLPNKLTMLRIILVPVFMIVLWLPLFTCVNSFFTDFLAAVIFAVSSITDFIDGKLARKYNLVSNFGKFMDPLADKFLIIGALLATIMTHEQFRFGLIIMLTLTIFRELAVSSMRLIAKNADNLVIAAELPGKIKTFSQCIFVLLLLLEKYIFAFSEFFITYRPLTWICMVVTIFFTIYSGIQYFITYKNYIFD